jgi:hypothetical protein
MDLLEFKGYLSRSPFQIREVGANLNLIAPRKGNTSNYTVPALKHLPSVEVAEIIITNFQ